MRSVIARMAALGLIIGACSVAAEPTTTTTTEPSTTSTSTSTSTTSTTQLEADTSFLNGLPVSDPASMDRRVLAVKIDNHPRANPQSGIDKADMILEILVEGVTRLVTLWHESDSDYLGPMRSGRPTDSTILAALNEPTFAISGAQEWVQAVAVSKGVHLVGEVGAPATFRVSNRFAPHNLYVDTMELRKVADGRGYPDDPPTEPVWPFGPMPADATGASSVRIDFSGNIVIWDWDTKTGTWLRTAYGDEAFYADADGTEARIEVPVMVALYVEQYSATPPPGWGGTGLPSSQTVGEGKAFVFADGKVVEGTWERAAEEEWFTLKGADGQELTVPPGKVWVSLVPDNRGLTIEE